MKKMFICFIVIMLLVITLTGCKRRNNPEKEQNVIDNNVISDTVNSSTENVENNDTTVQNAVNEDKNDVINTSPTDNNVSNNEVVDSSQNNENNNDTTHVVDTSDGEGITEDLEIQIGDNEGIGGL